MFNVTNVTNVTKVTQSRHRLGIPLQRAVRTAERSSWVVQLTGQLGLTGPGRVIDSRRLYGRQGRLTLAMLVLERHRPVSRYELTDVLWPNGPPRTWDPALRGVISKVRRFVSTAGLPCTLSAGGDGTYRFQMAPPVGVDIESGQANLEAGKRALGHDNPVRAVALACEAREVATQPFLPDVQGDWVSGVRERLKETLLWTHCLLGEAYARLGRHGLAARSAESAIALEPFREVSHRLLIWIHTRAGNRAEAVRAYHRCRALLLDELGVEPAVETTALHLAVLRHEPLPAPDDRMSR